MDSLNLSQVSESDNLKEKSKCDRLHIQTDQASLSSLNRNSRFSRNCDTSDNVTVTASTSFCSHSTDNWQSFKTTIRERIDHMYNNECLADVHFLVGKGTNTHRIPAHKFVLSVSSTVFYAMFYGPLASESDEIELPDIEPSALFALLRFLYTDNVRIGPETVMTTLYAAKKYAIPALEKHCVEFLEHNLSPDNAFMLLTQARLFDESELANLCLKTIDKNTSDAFAAEGFTDIDINTLRCVLIRDSLRIKEVELFKAVVRWAEAECERKGVSDTTENKRKILEDVVRLIRFPLMRIEEFANTVGRSGLLTPEQTVSIFMYLTVNPKPMIEFVETPRSDVYGKELLVDRFRKTEMRWGYSGNSDRIKFIVDQPIVVIGYGLFGSVGKPAEYSVLIQLIQSSNSELLGSNDTTFMSDGSSSKFRVMFKEPIHILSNTTYVASATIKGQDSYYGSMGFKKVAVDSLGGKINFHFMYSSENNNGSSVEDGQIPQILFHF